MSEHHEPTHDSLDEAVEAFQRLNVPDKPVDAVVLARLDALMPRPSPSGRGVGGEGRPVAVPGSSKRSGYFMRFLVPSAAAAALVIGGVGLLLLYGTATIALADVVKAAQKHKLVRYRQQQITDTEARTGARVDSTVYADFTAPRLYSESRVNDPEGESVLLSVHDGKHHLKTNSRRKAARLGFAPKDYKSLLCCLEEFQQKKGVTCAKCDLDGQPTVKYRHVEDKQSIILWVDAKTKLPLRLEQEFTDPTPDITRRALIWTDFSWDPQLPHGFTSLDELFSTRPPHGYALDDQIKER
jgi:hypothetical protein